MKRIKVIPYVFLFVLGCILIMSFSPMVSFFVEHGYDKELLPILRTTMICSHLFFSAWIIVRNQVSFMKSSFWTIGGFIFTLLMLIWGTICPFVVSPTGDAISKIVVLLCSPVCMITSIGMFPDLMQRVEKR